MEHIEPQSLEEQRHVGPDDEFTNSDIYHTPVTQSVLDLAELEVSYC